MKRFFVIFSCVLGSIACRNGSSNNGVGASQSDSVDSTKKTQCTLDELSEVENAKRCAPQKLIPSQCKPPGDTRTYCCIDTEGNAAPHGTKHGPYTCLPDGSWG